VVPLDFLSQGLPKARPPLPSMIQLMDAISYVGRWEGAKTVCKGAYYISNLLILRASGVRAAIFARMGWIMKHKVAWDTPHGTFISSFSRHVCGECYFLYVTAKYCISFEPFVKSRGFGHGNEIKFGEGEQMFSLKHSFG
jgi:hypothetical protein